ncbi:MAG TPA: hypothetical protein VMQ65_11095 [Candidatus Limnocylindria bacterium]|nr:hypothetical protein [Candidatus Limnocylindria bacterium]
MNSRGAARIEVALLIGVLVGGTVVVSGAVPDGSGGGTAGIVEAAPPGDGPSVITMTGSSSTFDVRDLPQLPANSRRDEVAERHGPRAPLQGGTAFAEVGSGTGAIAAPAPPSLNSFEGLAFNEDCDGDQCGDGHPPDTNGDVGPTYYIQTINTAIGIYNKATGSRVAGFTFNAFMSQGNFGNLCDTDNFGDPVVLYDTFEDRWVVSDFAFQVDGSGNIANPPGAFQCIAVSQSGDPVSGGWNYYSLHLTDGLHDYPKLGIWPDGIYMSANMFDFAAGGSYQNVRVWALEKDAMYDGLPADAVAFDAPDRTGPCTVFTLLPSNARVQTGTPPAGRENMFSSAWCYTTRVRIWKFHVDWAIPGNSTFTGPTDSMTSTAWDSGPGTVPELDGNELDALPMRLMMQNQYSNIGGVESLWNSHTVAGASAAQAAVRWYQVPVTGGTIGDAVQASTFNPDSNHRFMPSVAVDRLGNMAIGYSVTGASMYPAIRYAGRLAGDPVNTITQTETSLINGTGAQVGNCGGGPCERWGDYSAMTLDPDGCTFWYTNEYYADLSLNHKTRIGSFRYAGCTDAPPPTPVPPTPTPVPPTPTAPGDTTAPSVTNPALSPNPAIPGATVAVTSTATDAVAVASAQTQLDGGAWTSMTAVDGGFGEANEAVASTIAAPASAGSHQVCVRATDTSGNTSNGAACSTLTVMSYSLSPTSASASARQGASATYTINISRSSFPASIDLSVSGLPAGTTASFNPDPAGGASSLLTVTTSNCGTVTPRGTYPLTVTGLASGLTRTTNVSLAVTNAPPKVTSPASTLYMNTTLGTSTVRVKTSWSGCDPDGVTLYKLQRQVNGGPWTKVSLRSATSLSINQSLTRGSSYRFRVRATDGLGVTSAYAYSPKFTPRASDNTSGLIAYAGSWSTGTPSSCYGGTVRYAKAAGASATYTFTGKSVAWIAYKGPNRGSARVYVDGVLKATVSLHATTKKARPQVFAFNWSTSGAHTIRVVVVGTAGHPRVDVDAFVRLAPT